MEAIGRLTAGMAYHFTNILQGIQGNIDLAMLRAPDELRPYLTQPTTTHSRRLK